VKDTFVRPLTEAVKEVASPLTVDEKPSSDDISAYKDRWRAVVKDVKANNTDVDGSTIATAWRVIDEGDPGALRVYGTKNNPAPHVPVMSYGAAHRWEALAKAKGVSAVARSSRGFMRAYEKAGTWARLNPWWKARRNAFVARHMAQVRQNREKLWKPDKSGNLRPSRRCLALLMWSYMPRKS
jgi:hypothetical protein